LICWRKNHEKNRDFLLCLALSLALAAPTIAYGQVRKRPGRTIYVPITATAAKDHIGEEATVCGEVASARYAASSRGRPTFLSLDKAYPNEPFTVVIWGENRAKFGKPEQAYKDKEICITGKIETYKGKPQIVAGDPVQIQSKDMVLKGKKILQN
jgi:hypothetical protein